MTVDKNLKTISIKDYCTMKNYNYEVIKDTYSQEIHLPNYFESQNMNKSNIESIYPETYVCELENVNVIGENCIIFDDTYCIYDMPFRDKEDKFRLEIRNVIQSSRENTKIRYDDTKDIINISEGIMLLSAVSYNYFHFNVELLTKLCVIDLITKYKDIPLIVDSRAYNVPQFREELELIGNKRKIICVEQGQICKFEKLIQISDMMILPYNLKKGKSYKYEDCIINSMGIRVLSNRLKMTKDKDALYKKLFISRKNGSIKRLQNDKEVEGIFKDNGYEIIYPENMTFTEQLKIFSEASCIAGASGSGLTNIIFTDESCKLICIYPNEVELSCYSNLAGVQGKVNYFLDAKMEKNRFGYEYNTGDFTLDINYLNRFLREKSN